MSADERMLLDHYDALDAAIDFDRPFRVIDEGTIDYPADVFDPEVYVDVDDDGSITPTGEADMIDYVRHQGWEPVDGYSGQQGYSGPIMHASERLGGGMARDVMQTPGTYVVCAVECLGPDELQETPAGWILLRRRDERAGL